MKIHLTVLLAAVLTTGGLLATPAEAVDPHAVSQLRAMRHADQRPWHGNYYYMPYGHPTALVVPPTAHSRQTYSWGVSQNLMYPLTHQYGRNASYPGALPPGSFLPTPGWPSHTDQFGLYYVRGPW